MNKKECPVCRSKHTIKYGVRDERGDVLHAEDVLQEVCPEHLRLALLVALAPPALGKLRRSEGYLFLGLHVCVCFRV